MEKCKTSLVLFVCENCVYLSQENVSAAGSPKHLFESCKNREEACTNFIGPRVSIKKKYLEAIISSYTLKRLKNALKVFVVVLSICLT